MPTRVFTKVGHNVNWARPYSLSSTRISSLKNTWYKVTGNEESTIRKINDKCKMKKYIFLLWTQRNFVNLFTIFLYDPHKTLQNSPCSARKPLIQPRKLLESSNDCGQKEIKRPFSPSLSFIRYFPSPHSLLYALKLSSETMLKSVKKRTSWKSELLAHSSPPSSLPKFQETI